MGCDCNSNSIQLPSYNLNTGTNLFGFNVPNWMGVWDGTISYPIGSIVSYNGSSWITSTTNVGNTPGSSGSWDIFALGGSQGVQGAQGNPGTNYDASCFKYVYLKATSASDPGVSKVKFDNNNISSATTIYINEVDASGGDLALVIPVTSILKFVNANNQDEYVILYITGYSQTCASGSCYDTATALYITGTVTTFTDASDIQVCSIALPGY